MKDKIRPLLDLRGGDECVKEGGTESRRTRRRKRTT